MIPKRKSEGEHNESWLMSYADMITLLLCFFIIFVSVSEPRKDMFSEITHGMANKFGAVDLSTPFSSAYGLMQGVIEKNRMLRDVAVTRTNKGIEMELSNTFYQPGSAEINPEQAAVLKEMVSALKTIDYMDFRITIEGHTSDLPIVSPQYPSNWELSSARATRMVRFFVEQGVKPETMEAIGYADTRPKVPNVDGNGIAIPQNREQNQRVVIEIERK